MDAKAEALAVVEQMPPGATMAQIVARLTDLFILPTAPGEPVSESQAEANWAPVINKRMEEMLSGEVAGVPAEEVFEQGRRILRR